MSTTAQSSGRHLSIGEVLAQLRDDFPDVTISKIRFLESQGLIDPERTPSGYRKFYAPDLARLRWILGQQRDHFLPLRVIKARLDAFGPTGAPPGESARESTPELLEPALREPEVRDREVRDPDPPVRPSTPEPRDLTPAPRESIREPRKDAAPAPPSPPEHIDRPRPTTGDVPRATPPVSQPPATPPSPPPAPATPRPAAPPSRPAPPPSPPAPAAPVDLPFDDFVDDVEEATEGLGTIQRSDAVPGTNGMSRAELLEATGLSELQLDALEEYGIVTALVGDGERALYDDEALTLAELSAGYYSRGIEARHLKMYQHFSEREAALFAQVLVQYVRQRNPKSRARLQEELEELARLGRRLRTAMLRRALGKSLTA